MHVYISKCTSDLKNLKTDEVVMVGSEMKRKVSSPRLDFKTKYKKYFYGDLLLADFWQKL